MNKSYVQYQADKIGLDNLDVCSLQISGCNKTNWLLIRKELALHIIQLIDHEYQERDKNDE